MAVRHKAILAEQSTLQGLRRLSRLAKRCTQAQALSALGHKRARERAGVVF